MPLQGEKRIEREAAEKWGIDVSLLEANLQRTPTERLILHENSLTTAEQLREAVQNAHTQRDPEAPARK